jgi:XTP/dITP diphosphohydrolase
MKFTQTKLLIASGNEGKIMEIREIMSDFNVEIVSAKDFGIAEPEETGETFIENAVLKAKHYGDISGLPALADDSGLCVDALGGAPGIHSARWGGEAKDFNAAMKKVESELPDKKNAKAKFVCALALYWPKMPKNNLETVEGYVEGALTFPKRGTKGFGYDPIFIPKGYDKTFAEIDHEVKLKISHRADAFDKLIKKCFR